MKDSILNFYGFSRMPFGKQVSSKEIFKTKSFSEAMAMLELGVAEEDIILLTGPIGSGKSLILRASYETLDINNYHPVYLRGTGSSPAELYKAILRGLKVKPPHSILKTKPLFFSTIEEMKKKPVIFIDDTQDISPEALLSVKAMVNFSQDSSNKLTFILAGQPELRVTLGFSHFQAILSRIRLAIELTPMSVEETCRYIDHSLFIVQRKESLFSDSAKMEVFKRSGGLARKINTLCYRAIVSGVIGEKQIIDSQDIPEDTL